ncbi:MAG: DUF177 domain-containing protein [Actinomycetota bacterium]
MQEISVKEIFKKQMGASEDVELDFDPEQIDIPESIILKSLSGKAKLFRLEDSVMVTVKLKAELNLICDRCLDNFDTKVEFVTEREYLFDRKQDNENDEGYVDKYFNVDILPEVREELILAVPTKNLCKKDCAGICLTCGVNLNHQECKCKI